MPNRRDFLKTAAFATLGSGIAVSQVLAGECMPLLFMLINMV